MSKFRSFTVPASTRAEKQEPRATKRWDVGARVLLDAFSCRDVLFLSDKPVLLTTVGHQSTTDSLCELPLDPEDTDISRRAMDTSL